MDEFGMFVTFDNNLPCHFEQPFSFVIGY